MAALAARARHRGPLVVLLVILYMLGMTLIPFAINPLAGGRMPDRTLVSVPYVFWFFAAAVALSPIVWLWRVGIALVIVVALQCLCTFSSFQAQKRLVLDHDRQLASQLYQRIVAAVPDFDRKRTYHVEFYGAHEFRGPYKEVRRSTWSASFLEWDGGNPIRIIEFMNILGYSNLARIDEAMRTPLLPVAEKMPIWPAAGSVRVVDGVIVIRLGQRPGAVHRKAMEELEP